MDTTRYPHDLHELTKWAVNRKTAEPPQEYIDWIHTIMPRACQDVIGHHLNCYTPDTPVVGDWVRGYPHSHVWSVDWPPETFSILTYLAVAEDGGEFALGGYERDDPYELYKPARRDVFMFDATRWHGVKPVRRGTRISLLTSGTPDIG